jgi:lipopolysaccharide transport system ATP-binding protein
MKLSFQYLINLFKSHSSIVILDDFFPNVLSAFRVAEYNWYLNLFPRLRIYSTNSDFKSVHAEYARLYPQFADRVKPYDDSSLNDCTFVFMNFLNNAHSFLPSLSLRSIPFLMTLYPGGGFGLGEPESDAKLDQILSSPLILGVIATQSITVDYLKNRKFNVPIHYIYGGTMHPSYFENVKVKKLPSNNSDTVKICFVAERYMPQGANKGYPQFIEAAKYLIKEFPNLEFSVVGSFNQEDYPLDEKIRTVITFHGLLSTTELKDFFLNQHIIISPNRPFLLHPGNFDGFPTGCCVEASLCGVVVVCSDELKLNRYYTNGEDMIICDPVPDTIAKEVGNLIQDPILLRSIGDCGQRTSQTVFNTNSQLGQRSALLKKYAAGTRGRDIRSEKF